MAVILKDGSVFLHIPKTGGTWVTGVLRDLGFARCSIGHRHANWPHILAPGFQGVGRKCEYLYKRGRYLRRHPRPFTFCFVRHPLSWYESFYRYKSQPGIDWERDGDADDFNRWHPNAVLNGLGCEVDGTARDFNSFVAAVHEKFPGYVTALYDHFSLYPVDFIGKQESLSDGLAAVLERLGFDFDPAMIYDSNAVNVSSGKPSGMEWDRDLRERVQAAEAGAMMRFGYE